MIDVSNYDEACCWLEERMNEGLESVRNATQTIGYQKYGFFYESCMRWLIQIFYFRVKQLGMEAPTLTKNKSTLQVLNEAENLSENLYDAYSVAMGMYSASVFKRKSVKRISAKMISDMDNNSMDSAIFGLHNVHIIELIIKHRMQLSEAINYEQRLSKFSEKAAFNRYDFLGLCSLSTGDYDEWISYLYNATDIRVAILPQDSVIKPYVAKFQSLSSSVIIANIESRKSATAIKNRWQVKALQSAQGYLEQNHIKYPSDTDIIDYIRAEWVESEFGTKKRGDGSIRPLLKVWREEKLIPSEEEWNKNSI